MLRSFLLALLVLVAAGCTTLRGAETVVVAAEASQELECMSDCLQEPDVSCDDCAMRCFQAPAAGTVIGAR